MKTITFFLMVALLLNSCKDETQKPLPEIEGKWEYSKKTNTEAEDDIYIEIYKIKHISDSVYSVDISKYYEDFKDGHVNDRNITRKCYYDSSFNAIVFKDGTTYYFNDDLTTISRNKKYVLKKVRE